MEWGKKTWQNTNKNYLLDTYSTVQLFCSTNICKYGEAKAFDFHVQFIPIDFWLTREQNQKHNTVGFKVLINIKVNIVFQSHGAVVKAAGEQQILTEESGSSGGPLKRDDPCSPQDQSMRRGARKGMSP